MNGSFLYLANSQTPKVSGSMLSTFLPKKANPAVTHSAITEAPLGFTPENISVNTLKKPTSATLSNAAPSPPTAM
jgi:hypothetical protein